MLLDESLQSVDEAEVVVDEFQVEGGEPFIVLPFLFFEGNIRWS